jgi:hypothetical protein
MISLDWCHQGLPGDGRDHTGARKCPQNNPWGVVNSASKKIIAYTILFTSN